MKGLVKTPAPAEALGKATARVHLAKHRRSLLHVTAVVRSCAVRGRLGTAASMPFVETASKNIVLVRLSPCYLFVCVHAVHLIL